MSTFHTALLEATPARSAEATFRRGRGQQTFITSLREHLLRRLPNYMIPSTFVVLKALPLSANGKVDPKRLPEPDPEALTAAPEFVSPATQLERAIAGAWKDLLGVPSVGLNDNFFDLGGHSLMIVRLQGQLRRELGIEVTLTELFQFPTVGSLARALARQQALLVHTEASVGTAN